MKKAVSRPSRKKNTGPAPSARILSAGEPKPFRVENARGQGGGVIIGDHASSRVPRALKNLGLKKEDLQKHIGWDIGTEDIALYLGKALDMPTILAQYSRLLVDLNRAPHHYECMAESSDHITIPANTGLSEKDKKRRLREIYWPYQDQIGRQVDRLVRRKKTPVLLAIHSFTPELDEKKRPWHISLLWRREEKIAKMIVAEIRKSHPDLLVGENEPYTLRDERFLGSTICRHAEERGLPYVFVEFRQDLVNTPEKALRWAEVFLQALRPVLENPEIYSGRKIKPLKKRLT